MKRKKKFTFHPDNDPKHTSRLRRQWLNQKKRSMFLTSPDMNPAKKSLTWPEVVCVQEISLKFYGSWMFLQERGGKYCQVKMCTANRAYFKKGCFNRILVQGCFLFLLVLLFSCIRWNFTFRVEKFISWNYLSWFHFWHLQKTVILREVCERFFFFFIFFFLSETGPFQNF